MLLSLERGQVGRQVVDIGGQCGHLSGQFVDSLLALDELPFEQAGIALGGGQIGSQRVARGHSPGHLQLQIGLGGAQRLIVGRQYAQMVAKAQLGLE